MAFDDRVVAVEGRIGRRAGGGTRDLCGMIELDVAAVTTGREEAEVVVVVVLGADANIPPLVDA